MENIDDKGLRQSGGASDAADAGGGSEVSGERRGMASQDDQASSVGGRDTAADEAVEAARAALVSDHLRRYRGSPMGLQITSSPEYIRSLEEQTRGADRPFRVLPRHVWRHRRNPYQRF